MSLLGVGSLAFDSVYTPNDCRERIIGGSATYFAYGASFFGPVRLVGMVGKDWPESHFEMFRNRKIDPAGVRQFSDRNSYFWAGRYDKDLQDRETLEVQINGFDQFEPVVPDSFADSRFVFLAAAAPSVQLKTLRQCPKRELTFADTVDMWIDSSRDDLTTLLQQIDGLMINDSEVRQFTGIHNLVQAGRAIQRLGPRYVVIKKGEHGCLFFNESDVVAIPAIPTDHVIDPTGAGDSFAGGMMGYLAYHSHRDTNSLRNALLYGAVVASFTIGGFGLEGFHNVDRAVIDERYRHFVRTFQDA